MDKNRRLTLKLGAGAGVLATSAGLGGLALTTSDDALACAVIPEQAKVAGQFSLQVKHSWAQNDIAVVLTNNGSEASTITAITPLQVSLARGSLDFDKLLNGCPLSMAPGESVEIPLEHHPVTADDIAVTSYGHFDRSLQAQLKEQVSIETEGQLVAKVSVVPSPAIG